MLLNIVSLFCLEAVCLVSCSSSSSAGKLGITLGFSQTWKSFGLNGIKRQCSYSGFAHVCSPYLPVEPNWQAQRANRSKQELVWEWIFVTFKDSLAVKWKALMAKHPTGGEKEKDILMENTVTLWNSEIIKKSFYLHTAPGERTGMEPSAAGRAPYRAEHGREQQRALPWCWMGTLRKGKAKSHILIFHSLAYCSFKKDVWKVFHSTLFLHTPSKIRKGQLAPAAQSPQTPSPLSLIDVAPKSHGGIWGRVLPPVGRGMRFSRHTIINPTVRSWQ